MKTINLEQLIAAVKASTRKYTVLVPSNAFYARHGDYDEVDIQVIGAPELIAELEKLL